MTGLTPMIPGSFDNGLTTFNVSVTNTLVADPAAPGASAMIQKTSGRIIIPEPSTLLLFCGLAAVSLRRARRGGR
jgi:hypothetical protein